MNTNNQKYPEEALQPSAGDWPDPSMSRHWPSNKPAAANPGYVVCQIESFKSLTFNIFCWCGWEDRALQECNLSAQSSVDCGCILSRSSTVWRREFSLEDCLRKLRIMR